jgi:hypothetical protein
MVVAIAPSKPATVWGKKRPLSEFVEYRSISGLLLAVALQLNRSPTQESVTRTGSIHSASANI